MKGILKRFQNRRLLRDTIRTTAWSNLGKAVGLAVPFFIAAWFGASAETDAFFFSYTWITFLTLIFAPVLESVIVPFISDLRARGKDVGAFVARVLAFSVVTLLLFSSVAGSLISLLLPRLTHFSPAELPLVRNTLIRLTPLVVLTICTSIVAGTLNAYKRFALPAASTGLRALLVLTFGFAARKTLGINAIIWGYILGECVRLLVLSISLGYVPGFRLGFRLVARREITEFIRKAGQQTIGMAASEFSPLVDKAMASGMGVGAISMLTYAERLYLVPVIFLSSGFLVTLLSYWSGSYYRDFNRDDLKHSLRRSLFFIGGLSLLATAFLALLHHPLITIFYGRPGLDSNNLRQVAKLYLFMNLALCPHLLSYVLTRGFLTLKQTAVIRNLGLIRLLLKISLNLVLIRFWGLAGIVVATVLTSWLSLAYLGIAMKREMA